jgi:hypothetical protein
MAHPVPILTETQLRTALTVALDHIEAAGSTVAYRLVGTGAALLHGVDLPAADIDLLVRERADVDAIDAALEPFDRLRSPEWIAHTSQYYANYQVRGVEVGVSTVEVESTDDTIETFGPGPWVHYSVLACGPHQVPVVALELRLITELSRDRPDRFRPIIDHLRTRGCDLDLVTRGLAARVPEGVRERVVRELRGN